MRRRLRLGPVATIGTAALAPAALTVAARPTRTRNVAICVLQMLAYLQAYKLPFAEPELAAGRVHVRYPIAVDRLLGLGAVPSARLQRAFSKPGRVNGFERVLVWSHWLWFFVPHSAVAYVLIRAPERFPSAATRMYAVFDLGAVIYWAVPTAPPWWAAAEGHLEEIQEHLPVVRRVMIEYGERFWGARWADLYDVFGGNPLAAMPSLHFATSLMAARLLTEVGPVAGAVGWAYAATLGLALVYLGEHYVVDLIAGAALAGAVRAGAPRVAPLAGGVAGVLGRIGECARAAR